MNVRHKIDNSVYILENLKVISAKLVKKLIGTDFYELRISMGNEYRVIIISADNDSLIEARRVILLNGFIKKSTKDYNQQLIKAKNILNNVEL